MQLILSVSNFDMILCKTLQHDTGQKSLRHHGLETFGTRESSVEFIDFSILIDEKNSMRSYPMMGQALLENKLLYPSVPEA